MTNDFLHGPSSARPKDGKAKMKALLVLVALCFSASAFARASPPKVGNKPLVQVRPRAPMGCKLVGTLKGTKRGAGGATSPDPKTAPIAPPPPAPSAAQAAGAIPSDPKQ